MARRGASSCGQPAESLSILTFHLAPGASAHIRSRHEHEIETPFFRRSVESKGFSKEAAHSISDHRSAHPPTRRQTKPAVASRVLRRHHQEQRSIEPNASGEHPSELGAAAQSIARPKLRRGCSAAGFD